MAADRRRRPIGVFDSGLGGLTVLRALRRRLPCEDLIYFGDTARVPYGTKGEHTVRAFAQQDAGFLLGLGVKMIVVACNTASAFALDHLREFSPVPVLGVIEPGVSTALTRTRGGSVGVIGTSGTIRSGRYQAGLAVGGDGRPGVPAEKILARECPLFVPLAEEGLLDHDLTRLAVAEYLTELRDSDLDTLILGCTHYPLLKTAIGAFMGPDVALVDSADALADAAERLLCDEDLLRPPPGATAPGPDGGRQEFYLSDLPWKFGEIGARFLGRPIIEVKTVTLAQMERAGRENGRPI